ncbi:MAG: ATP-dependent Clp protease ATP-binding subunit ClpA [Oligoflexia bacterium]|nr:ATP-dependent Clp protease ATP-binding subunit ClpA [Oligoflexia bacterium]
MITPSLENSLNQAFQLAQKHNHEFVSLEHLLFTLLSDPDALNSLKACQVDIKEMQVDLESIFESLPKAPQSARPEPTLAFNRTLQRAILHAQSSSRSSVNGCDLLIHMFSEPDSQAVYVMEKQGIEKIDLLNYISHGIEKEELLTSEEGEPQSEESSPPAKRKGALDSFAIDLVERAREGKIDPLIGRENELERTMQVLCRRKKNNPIYVGEAGVGKTAIAEGLALHVFQGSVPEPLRNARVFSLDLTALLAGTKYRGDFEQRMKAVLKEIKQIPEAILFIDEIHTIIGAGSTEGSMDASNMLKPMLANGELRCIGATTYQEYRQIFDKNRALSRRFQKIDVPEPSVKDTIKILQGLKEKLEDHHGVKFTQNAIQAAVELSKKYLHERFLPDKAIDLLDEAGAANRLLPKSKQKSTISDRDIENMIAKQVQIPSKNVSMNDKTKLKNLYRDLKMLIYGQDEAVDKVTQAIKLNSSGLSAGEKPIGSFLFAGPTGVGKTELAKQLAHALGVKFLRYDMSEYMEKHAVSRLIGAPPGYVGFDQGGLLTEEMNKHPYSVVLFDEVEKAHPDLMNIMLQILDYGFLTDNNGRRSDFRNTIIIMTTNAGAHDMTASNSLGFSRAENKPVSGNRKAIERTFSPEFLNRLDAVVFFKGLDQQIILNVVDKFLIELENHLAEKNISVTFTDALRLWIAEKGYDPKYGARPIQRFIQDHVKKPLVDEVLFGELEKGGHVSIDYKKSKVDFQFKKQSKLPANKKAKTTTNEQES